MIVHLRDPHSRARAVGWLAKRLGMTSNDLVGPYPFEILGCYRRDRLIGAVLFNHWRGVSIEAHWAGDTGWLSRGNLKAIFGFPFNFLRVRRITAMVPTGNATACDVADRLGFVREGVLRQADDDGQDLIVLGMLRSECRWIDTGRDHGQEISTDV